MLMIRFPGAPLWLVFCVLLAGCAGRPVATGGEMYLERFSAHVDAALDRLPEIEVAAERGAPLMIEQRRLLYGHLEMIQGYEMIGRAGGMALAGWGPDRITRPFPPGALVVAAIPNTLGRNGGPFRLTPGLRMMLMTTSNVIAMGDQAMLEKVNAEFPALEPIKGDQFLAWIDNPVAGTTFAYQGARGMVQIDDAPLAQLIHDWMLHGELIAAATRRGAMPLVLLSFGLDERQDYTRAKRYSRRIPRWRSHGPQIPFHEDITVPPVASGQVSRAYVAALRQLTRELRRPAGWAPFEQLADEIVARHRAGQAVYLAAMGHTIPFIVPRDRWESGPMRILAGAWKGVTDSIGDVGQPGDLYILLGMPHFPRGKVIEALETGADVVVTGAEPPTGLTVEQARRVTWIPNRWPLEDAAVPVQGYDIDILPVSGVLNAAIYYALLTELADRLPIDADLTWR